MAIIKAVKEPTKEGFKQALIDACEDLKNRADDILCDFDKYIHSLNIEINIDYGKVSIIRITKDVLVMGEEDETIQEEA